MNDITFTRTLPVTDTYDVVVCGGGPAGFMAAVAASRQGARVALVERFGFLGGMATAGLVAPISVFSYNGKRVIGGLPWEFIERLEKVGGALVEQPLNNVSFDPELYKLTAQRMVLEAGVDFYGHSLLTGCQVEGGRIAAAVVSGKGGFQALAGRVFVDCTGDADLAHMAGVPMQEEEGPWQPGSLIFALDGVDTAHLPSMHHSRQGVNCQDMLSRQTLLDLGEDASEFGGPWFCTLLRPGRVLVNMTRSAVNALDARSLTQVECALREKAFHFAALLKAHVPAFRDCFIAQTAPVLGIRESRRILGLHTITAQEYLSGHRYADWITRSCHPVDVHQAGGAQQEVKFLERPAYIPYRALVAQGFDNLIVAGRSISAQRRAFASIRVQAPVMGMGQAAGVAAALAAQSGDSVTGLGERVHAMLAEKGACLED